MRIIGYIDHPVLKITVFKTDTRLSVKFEDGTLEQTYKLRPSEQLNSLGEVRQLVDDTLLHAVVERFRAMQRDLDAALGRQSPQRDDDDELPVIL